MFTSFWDLQGGPDSFYYVVICKTLKLTEDVLSFLPWKKVLTRVPPFPKWRSSWIFFSLNLQFCQDICRWGIFTNLSEQCLTDRECSLHAALCSCIHKEYIFSYNERDHVMQQVKQDKISSGAILFKTQPFLNKNVNCHKIDSPNFIPS